jgi:hypothetical protein
MQEIHKRAKIDRRMGSDPPASVLRITGRCDLALEAQDNVRSMDQAGSTNTEFGGTKEQVGTT